MERTEALAQYDQACNLAASGQWEAALARFDEAHRRGLDSAELHYGRGTVLQQTGRHLEAVGSYDEALARNPGLVFALNNRGTALLELTRPEDALESFEGALRLDSGYVRAWSNRSRALRDMGRAEEALVSADRALTLRPEDAGALNNRGNALWDLGRTGAAIESYERALRVNPDFVLALSNLCNALQNLQRHPEAAMLLERLVALAPDWKHARANLLTSRLHCCDWTNYEAQTSALVDAVAGGAHVTDPFQFLVISPSAKLQLTCARAYAGQKRPLADLPRVDFVRRGTDRIRLGYMSSDFRSHAVSFLMARLFETHNRDRFETIALSLGPEDTGPMGQRLASAFDRICDLTSLGDREAAATIRELGVDILVDLNGYTLGSRTGILANRAAPIQVNYLGFPGTTGSEYHDYILADDFVVPKQWREAYSEQVVHLPDSFQCNDDRRARSESMPTRSGERLPPHGLVFCCFNNPYKITPAVFAIWMRLLSAVPDSVLWLVSDNEPAIRNLSREALGHGVDPTRLVFARKLSYERHLQRIPLADLFLDTFPFNAGTTASDALWAGVPLLTCAGEAFASRMAGSLLRALDLPELVTHSMAEYEALALALSGHPSMLRDLRARLATNRYTHALFDTDRFRRHVEAAYSMMWKRHLSGEPPVGFAVDPISPLAS